MKDIIKKILGAKNRARIRYVIHQFDYFLCKLCVKSSFFSSFYYFLLSNKFRREHQAVLTGRLRYRESTIKPRLSSALLRRNIHRLEKGMIMFPRKDVYAEAYILETVKHYQVCVTENLVNTDEIKWGFDVLSNYFNIVRKDKSSIVRSAFAIFSKINTVTYRSELKYIPYERKSIETSGISYDDFKLLCKQRRSVRWFKEQQVEKEKIISAIEVATMAPSACNRQPFEFIVTTDSQSARDIGSIAMGTVGFCDNFQALIVIVGDLSAYPHERDRHVIYIDASLAAMQLMLALETLGLSSCPINWPDIEPLERKMSERLGLSIENRPVMLLAVGYAREDGLIPYSQKKEATVIFTEI
ncbi:nitroreductase family protein [Brenneria goodwinii]|uniref:nitroreductase family protein n=1 Tax=Brenneria goodwinii TaxID=1109412 RepID=UPI000EF2729E|nr:nitroreductase family protein [Brenneria goodwinii]MCG8158728.1 nitroreductase family protein [Brenneria goodwinii]MCG8163257.1 nitroreductase family protein [Brenneria goodwinii]MCG8167678.1 nitroreductase family protein [Brenneria goodwinii]MCG8170584.1 nitroreductase family protein [Brenneria goodwinii]MCG8174416.1 nitroreductase family protein [Brenneria goodwinii]